MIKIAIKSLKTSSRLRLIFHQDKAGPRGSIISFSPSVALSIINWVLGTIATINQDACSPTTIVKAFLISLILYQARAGEMVRCPRLTGPVMTFLNKYWIAILMYNAQFKAMSMSWFNSLERILAQLSASGPLLQYLGASNFFISFSIQGLK